MAWIVVLFRFFFPDNGRNALLHAAWTGARIILDVLVDRTTGAIHHDTAEGRRMAAQRLHDCNLAIFLALEDRAHEIAGLPLRHFAPSEMRLSELSRRDVSAPVLVKRARAIMDQLQRFERLARRRALKLKRHAERRRAMLNATTLTLLVLMLLAALTLDAADAPRLENTLAAFSDPRIRAPP